MDAEEILLKAFRDYAEQKLGLKSTPAAEYKTTAQAFIKYLKELHPGLRWFRFLRNTKAAGEFISSQYGELKTRKDKEKALQAFQQYLAGHGWVDWLAAWIRTYQQQAVVGLLVSLITLAIGVASAFGWPPQRIVGLVFPSATPTSTYTPTMTNTSVPTATPTVTRTATPTLTSSPTPTKTPTITPTPNRTQVLLATRHPTMDPSFYPVTRVTSDGIEQVWVPPGSFIAGDQHSLGYDDESPSHQVYADGFWIDRFLVTNAQFALCPEQVCSSPRKLGSHTRPTGYYGVSAFDNFPVIEVTWQQAYDHCGWQGGRLPTEAEFEKAAGWDPRTNEIRIYPWGDQPPDDTRANYNGVDRDTTAVDIYPDGISAVGAYDMAGNVWQWTADWYSETYYADNDSWINPTGPASGEFRVIRGGSWYSVNTLWLRVANRGKNRPDNFGNEIGFRCVFDK